MTTCRPAAPNFWPTMISSTARAASAGVWQIRTPLPSARPSALTAQRPCSAAAKSRAAFASEKVPECAVGIPYFSMNFCEKTLEDSNCAALRFGPQMRKPLAWNKSAMPSARGLSGPTTVRAGFFSRANASRDGRSSAAMAAHCTAAPFSVKHSAARPALPGAHHNRVRRGDCANFQTRACSRPPEPITRTFIAAD